MPRYRTIEEAMRRLDIEIHKIKDRALLGLIDIAHEVKDNMDAFPPLIPVDTGNMRKSFYCVTSRGHVPIGRSTAFSDKNKDAWMLELGHDRTIWLAKEMAMIDGKLRGPTVIIGLSAYYARYVHEMYGANFNFKRDDAGAGFFGASVSRVIPRMRTIMQFYTKVS